MTKEFENLIREASRPFMMQYGSQQAYDLAVEWVREDLEVHASLVGLDGEGRLRAQEKLREFTKLYPRKVTQ